MDYAVDSELCVHSVEPQVICSVTRQDHTASAAHWILSGRNLDRGSASPVGQALIPLLLYI